MTSSLTDMRLPTDIPFPSEAAEAQDNAQAGPYTPLPDLGALLWLSGLTSGNLLEIGCNRGETTLQLARALHEKTVYGVDVAFVDPTSPQAKENWRIWAPSHSSRLSGRIGIEAAAETNVQIRVIDSRMLDYATLPGVTMVFIDGDHHYEHVSRDTELALRAPGMEIIAWHDYCPPHTRDQHPRWIGVWRVVETMAAIRPVYHVMGTSLCYTDLREPAHQPTASVRRP